MRYYKDLYIGERMKPQNIRWRIRFNRIPPNFYVISFAKNEKDQLEIIQAGILKQPYYRKKRNAPFVLGIAGDYDEAVKLVQKILEDTMRDTQGFDMKSYLMGKAEGTC